MGNPQDFSRDNTDGDDFVYVLSNQSGARILNHANDAVFKKGHRVHFGEEVALRLVRQYTTVPVPWIIMSSYEGEVGSIVMDFVPGSTLSSIWHSFDDQTKQNVCRNTWSFIMQWREIQRPTTLSHLYQCLADGSLKTRDPLIQDLNDPPTALESDEAVRARIYQRYLHFFGQRHEHDLLGMIPRSSKSVFTHGDVAPQSILICQNGEIAGIIDWEHAGWYPEYWEYMNIMKPREDVDWKEWMDRTAPQRWDLSGIVAARRVLF